MDAQPLKAAYDPRPGCLMGSGTFRDTAQAMSRQTSNRRERIAPPRLAVILVTACVALAAAAEVNADRAPTPNERRAIARAMDLPRKCAKIRVSTVAKRPKWASLYWKPAAGCQPYAADGVALLKKKQREGRRARWRFVTAGSDFECRDLYGEVPRPVAEDLGIACR